MTTDPSTPDPAATSDATGLREGERLNLRSLNQAKALAAHPDPTPEPKTCPTPGCSGDVRYGAPGRGHITGCRYPLDGLHAPDASPDPAVVTPDAGDVEALIADLRARVSHVEAERDDALTAASVNRALQANPPDEDQVRSLSEALYGAGLEERLNVPEEALDMVAEVVLASDWLANHVAAAREADRAEVGDLRERLAAHCEERDAALVELADTEERLAGLVAKIEALADKWEQTGSFLHAAAARDLRALIPADAATALDAVKAEAKAEERNRIVRTIGMQGYRFSSRADHAEALAIAREVTP